MKSAGCRALALQRGGVSCWRSRRGRLRVCPSRRLSHGRVAVGPLPRRPGRAREEAQGAGPVRAAPRRREARDGRQHLRGRQVRGGQAPDADLRAEPQLLARGLLLPQREPALQVRRDRRRQRARLHGVARPVRHARGPVLRRRRRRAPGQVHLQPAQGPQGLRRRARRGLRRRDALRAAQGRAEHPRRRGPPLRLRLHAGRDAPLVPGRRGRLRPRGAQRDGVVRGQVRGKRSGRASPRRRGPAPAPSRTSSPSPTRAS